MVVRWVALLLLLPLLAGCSDAPTPKVADETDFGDLEVDATETTGVIRGVVVDDRIVPIGGAGITLGGATVQSNATTDDQGRFAFDGLEPGTYFLTATHLLYNQAQTTVDVVAGDDEPPIAKILLVRRFTQDAFHESYKHDGFIQCNQSGVVYATAPCITDFSSQVTGNLPPDQLPCVEGVRCCKPAGCFPELRRVLTENRGFTVALGPGWQSLIWEMTWKETSETFSQMGVTVSYNETERCACHNYGSYGSTSPLRMQIDVGVDFEPSNAAEPELIAPEGLPAMYYFVGVRDGPALAVNQQFQLFATFFYYGVPPEGWSFINEDPFPF